MLHLLVFLVFPSIVLANKTVHVVFSNHLDIGFDNIEPYVGYDSNVLNMYFNRYLPLAVDNANWMQRVSPHKDRYVYTTHAYLLSLFLDCPTGMGLHCPGPFTKNKVVHGIKSGAITWHAHPHNAQHEFYDPSLLEFSIDLVHDLDRRFGFKPKHTVILRDVPGLTRAVIPIFAAKGIKAVSIGVNPGSAPPAVPQYTPFIWRDEATDTQVLAFWRPGGYGGIHGGVNLDPPEQCIQAPGLDHVLCTAWRNDNAGPPLTVLEPLRIYQLLRQEWGGTGSSSSSSNASSSSSSNNDETSSGGSSSRIDDATTTTSSSNNDDTSSSSSRSSSGVTIKASSFDDFVDAVLEALPHLNLTVVTGEIGDTWVFGVQSDPLKTANFRAASRARAHCSSSPRCPSEGGSFYNFSRLLLKVPEHTWGVDVKKTLHDWDNFSNPDFHSCLPNYWQQQQQQQRQQLDTMMPSDSGSSSSSSAASGVGGAAAETAGSSDGVPLRKAPCLNYEHCLHAWDRQAAYINWALQALPPDHPVLLLYHLDLANRQQLATINKEKLLADGAVVHIVQHSVGRALTGRAQSFVTQNRRLGEAGAFAADVATGSKSRTRSSSSSSSSSSRRLSHVPHQTSAKHHMHEQQKQHVRAQQQQQQQNTHEQQQQQADATQAAPAIDHQRRVAPGLGVRKYVCGSWRFELDESQGAITSLQKLYTEQYTPGVDWAAGSSSSGSSSSGSSSSSTAPPQKSDCAASKHVFSRGIFGQIKYSAYCEASYDVIWKHYAWQLPLPWWFAQDFSGRVNSSRAWDKEVELAAHLEEIYESFAPNTTAGAGGGAAADDGTAAGSSSAQVVQLSLRYSFPQELVQQVGAPQSMWTIISCPAMSPIPGGSSTASPGDLEVAVVWQAKAPTRLPEALWLSFVPAAGAVDPSTWRMHKLNSLVDPREVILNGSQSMHAVSDAGVSVHSADHSELLQIKTWDASLVSPGKPTPFPNGVFAPCMDEGMHFNLMNNIWGTNYVMWVPYSKDDVNLAFRFSIHAEQLPAAAS